jgi:hypothetical protein
MNHRVVCSAPEEWKILRQITGEANEFGAARFEPYGCTVSDVKELVAILRQKPVPPTGVCFAFVEPGGPFADDSAFRTLGNLLSPADVGNAP